MSRKAFTYITLIILILGSDLYGQDSLRREAWVDSVFNSLSSEERIAQLMVVRANDPGKDYYSSIDKYIERYNIGGVCFFRNHPHQQLRATNHWQKKAKTPLLVSIDAEWGLGMRLDSTMSFPYQMTLGAIQDNSLIYKMGALIAQHCKRMGIQMNFAPVVDINSNPGNPVIGMRSFGQDRENVMFKGLAYMQGLQDNGIIATAKHFPGHGDTDTDSHKTLPEINHSKDRLDSLELFPFRNMIKNGLRGIMIAHLDVPAYETQNGVASTLSKNIVQGLLRQQMGFNGLIVTDALDMKGVTKYFRPGDIEILALKAGNDILLLPADVPKAVRRIQRAVDKGELSETIIDERCRKVLYYKYDAGLAEVKEIETAGLYEHLNDNTSRLLNRKLYENSFTLLKNADTLLPLMRLDTLKIAYVNIGGTTAGDHFAKMLQLYGRVDIFSFDSRQEMNDIPDLIDALRPFNLVIMGVGNTNIFAGKDYGISDSDRALISRIAAQKKCVLNIFASPYALSAMKFKRMPDVVALSYQDNKMAREVAAEVIFGGISARGKLPVSVEPYFGMGEGLETRQVRLSFTDPLELGIEQKYIDKADSVVLSGIQMKAYPGCQVLAAKDGKIFYYKNFGYHTYDEDREVIETDLYDLASITKIAATTLAMMDLYEKGRIDIDRRLSRYLPYLAFTDKKDLIIREILAHQSRLKAWIPYYKYTVEDSVRAVIYAADISEDFPVRVANGMYIHKDYDVVINDSIRFSRLQKSSHYKYSDLGFYMLKESIEAILNTPFEQYAETRFYARLGLPTMGFLPLKRFSPERIVPTEDDKIFRKQWLQGDVHDQGAAMLGGVSGHAGLFSNAFDLAVIMQMLIQGGEYGGEEYLSSGVIREFTQTQFPLNQNRRGIGFDKPLLEYDEDGPTCQSASHESYGHSGFTGTYTWADPANGLVYVFLSNRVSPDASNAKIMEYDIRTNLHQVFYDAIRIAGTLPPDTIVE